MSFVPFASSQAISPLNFWLLLLVESWALEYQGRGLWGCIAFKPDLLGLIHFFHTACRTCSTLGKWKRILLAGSPYLEHHPTIRIMHLRKCTKRKKVIFLSIFFLSIRTMKTLSLQIFFLLYLFWVRMRNGINCFHFPHHLSLWLRVMGCYPCLTVGQACTTEMASTLLHLPPSRIQLRRAIITMHVPSILGCFYSSEPWPDLKLKLLDSTHFLLLCRLCDLILW